MMRKCERSKRENASRAAETKNDVNDVQRKQLLYVVISIGCVMFLGKSAVS